MTAKEIYKSTKKFPIRLLLLNLVCFAISFVVLLVFFVITMITKSSGVLLTGMFISFFIYVILFAVVNNYIGYMFKYGAVHAIAMAWWNGEISDTYFDDSVEYIKSGFIKANAYLVIDKLINAAVRGVTRLVNFVLGFLPDSIQNMANTFINIYLNYIDECCLAWSMIHDDENVVEMSCDGIVIYYQNAKQMLKPALKSTLRIVLVDLAIMLVGMCFILFPPAAYAVWLIGFGVVNPFLNHRVLCDTMVSYLDLAEQTELQTDLYDKLTKCKPFQKLRSKVDDPMFDTVV